MNTKSDIDLRKLEESNEVLAEAVPPADVVAFVESRSCADLFRLFKKQQLNLSPSFQRKIVWNDRAQTLFIDSLIKQLPIPSLCLCYDVKSQWRVVIDGLQRLHTIVKFLNHEELDWRLQKCADVDKRISGKYVSEICAKSPEVYCRLENLTLPITVIRCDMSKPSHNHRLRDVIKERVIGVVYSAKYQAVKDLFVDIIGSVRFHFMMDRLEKRGQRQMLIDRLNELNAERCSAAHTYFENGVMKSYKSPSETISKFKDLLPIMQSIEKSVSNFARRGGTH